MAKVVPTEMALLPRPCYLKMKQINKMKKKKTFLKDKCQNFFFLYFARFGSVPDIHIIIEIKLIVEIAFLYQINSLPHE